jgi:hypothetical protein
MPFLAGQLKRRLAEDVDLKAVAGLPSLYRPTVRGLLEIITFAAQRADYETGETVLLCLIVIFWGCSGL